MARELLENCQGDTKLCRDALSALVEPSRSAIIDSILGRLAKMVPAPTTVAGEVSDAQVASLYSESKEALEEMGVKYSQRSGGDCSE